MDRTGVYIAAYRMVDQHWTTKQMVDEFSSHHQKKWWPIFRKYEGKVVAYAKKKGVDTKDDAELNTVAKKVSPDSKQSIAAKTDPATKSVDEDSKAEVKMTAAPQR